MQLRRSLFSSVLVCLVIACSSNGTTPPAPIVDASVGVDASLDPSGSPPKCTSGAKGGGVPTPRGDTAAALSPLADKLVLFGGDTGNTPCGGAPSHAHVGDTWVMDVVCGVWRQVQTDSPDARSRHSMITDAKNNRALLFGGRTRPGSSGSYTLFNDVWTFDFTAETWQKLATSGAAPSARSNSAITLDTTGNQLIVFGGNTSVSGLSFSPMDDTYVLDLATLAWRALAPATKPPARLFHAMAMDDSARTAYVYGGGDANAFAGPFLTDLWALDVAAETWKAVTTSGKAPNGRIKHGLTFDTTQKQLLMFGGHDDGEIGNENDVYALDVSSHAWSRLPGGDTINKPSSATCVFAPDFTNIDKNDPSDAVRLGLPRVSMGADSSWSRVKVTAVCWATHGGGATVAPLGQASKALRSGSPVCALRRPAAVCAAKGPHP